MKLSKTAMWFLSHWAEFPRKKGEFVQLNGAERVRALNVRAFAALAALGAIHEVKRFTRPYVRCRRGESQPRTELVIRYRVDPKRVSEILDQERRRGARGRGSAKAKAKARSRRRRSECPECGAASHPISPEEQLDRMAAIAVAFNDACIEANAQDFEGLIAAAMFLGKSQTDGLFDHLKPRFQEIVTAFVDGVLGPPNDETGERESPALH
jgi:hypothetical protein